MGGYASASSEGSLDGLAQASDWQRRNCRFELTVSIVNDMAVWVRTADPNFAGVYTRVPLAETGEQPAAYVRTGAGPVDAPSGFQGSSSGHGYASRASQRAMGRSKAASVESLAAFGTPDNQASDASRMSGMSGMSGLSIASGAGDAGTAAYEFAGVTTMSSRSSGGAEMVLKGSTAKCLHYWKDPDDVGDTCTGWWLSEAVGADEYEATATGAPDAPEGCAAWTQHGNAVQLAVTRLDADTLSVDAADPALAGVYARSSSEETSCCPCAYRQTGAPPVPTAPPLVLHYWKDPADEGDTCTGWWLSEAVGADEFTAMCAGTLGGLEKCTGWDQAGSAGKKNGRIKPRVQGQSR